MLTTTKSNQSSLRISHFDWAFLSNLLSGTAGIILGCIIAIMLGWI